MAFKILLHTFRMIFGNFGQALKLSIGPYAILIGGVIVIGSVINKLAGGSSLQPSYIVLAWLPLIFLPAVIFVASWVAVSWHRFILLEEYTKILPSLKDRPIWRYAGKAILLGLLLGAIVLPIFWIFSSIIVVRPSQNFGFAPVFFLLLYFVGVLLLSGAAMRLGVALVGTAVGNPMRFRDAWYATSKVSFVVLGVAAILIVFQLIGSVVLAIIAFQLPFDLIRPVAAVLNVTLNWTMMMLGISILTTLYGHVIEDRPLVS